MKANQPTLFKQLKRLPWAQIPVGDRTRGPGHGRRETRTVKAVTVHLSGGIAWSHDLLTVASGEWDDLSWRLEGDTVVDPTKVVLGRAWDLKIFRCPVSVEHPAATAAQ